MATRFGTSGWREVTTDEFPCAGIRSVANTICSQFDLYNGELINEDKIVTDGEGSAGLSIKDHYPKKDGIPAGLLAAEAVAARGASVNSRVCH